MFRKELILKYIDDEINDYAESIVYLGDKKLSNITVDRFVALEKAKDNKCLLEKLKFKISGCEFDE